MNLGRFLPPLPRQHSAQQGNARRDGAGARTAGTAGAGVAGKAVTARRNQSTLWLDGTRACVLGPAGGILRNLPLDAAGDVAAALKVLDSLIVKSEKTLLGVPRLRVLLGAGFVQYVVVPWQSGPPNARPADWIPLARRQLVQHGVAGGESWRLAISDGPWGQSRLAVAVPEPLCAGIQRLGKARGMRAIAIEPAFTLGVASYARRMHEGEIAIVELEPAGAHTALAQIGFRRGGQWTGFIALPVAGALDAVLRDAGMLCAAGTPEHVYVIASTGAASDAFWPAAQTPGVEWWPAPWGAIE